MSGLQSILQYAFQAAPAYGIPGVVNLASPTASYTAKPTDYAILVDLSGYSAAGPTINWCPTPQEDFPVLVRNTKGSTATHTITLNAPAGLTIEDPGNVGTFAASITLASSSGFESAVWVLDRQNQRLVLFFGAGGSGGGGGGALPPFALFVDPQNVSGVASNANTGQTNNNVPPGSGPILTTAENNRRAVAPLTANTLTTYMSDDNAGVPAVVPPMGNFSFQFLGTPQVLATTTVTAVTAINPAANQAELITTALASMQPYVLPNANVGNGGGTSAFPTFFRVVGGARAGNTARIVQTTSGEGGSVAQVACDRPQLPNWSTGSTIQVGDTVQICRGSNFYAANVEQLTVQLTYQFLRFLNSFIQDCDSSVQFLGCSFDAIRFASGSDTGCFTWNGVEIGIGGVSLFDGVYLPISGDNGTLLSLSGDVYVGGPNPVIAAPAAWQTVTVFQAQGAGAQFWNNGNSCIDCLSSQILGAGQPGVTIAHALLWGSAQAAVAAIRVFPGVTVTVSSQTGTIPTVTGSGTPVAFMVPAASGILTSTTQAVRATPGPPAAGYDGPHSTLLWSNIIGATFNFAAHLLESNAHVVAIPG